MNHEFSVYDPHDQGPAKFGPRRLYKGGGGGQTSTTTPSIPDELKPLAALYTQQATQVAQTPFQSYNGKRYADLNGSQNQALQMVQDRATGGNQTFDAGDSYLRSMFGTQAPTATQNPYGNVAAGQNTNTVNAGWNASQITPGQNTNTVSAGSNAYAGSNPYLQANIDAALGDVTRSYKNTVMPQQTNAVVGSGSFGNSGVQQVQAEQERQLAEQLGNVASSMRMQDYTQQQGLAENALNRGLQAQQFNAGLTENNLSRDMAAQQFNSGLTDTNLARSLQAQQFNSGLTDSNLNRDFSAQQFNANMGNDWAQRNDSLGSNWRSQNLSALGLVPQYSNQSYTDAAQLLNAGNVQQNQAQQGLDFNFQQFQDQQNYPYKQLAAIGGVLGQNMGQTTTQSGGGK